MQRIKIQIQGAVQGVGFRPFVYRTARALGLTGWVCNAPQGVTIEAEGDIRALESFLAGLEFEKPQPAKLYSIKHQFSDPVGYSEFHIRKSTAKGDCSAWILPDIATCPDCLNELFDPDNRRYLYPFINCTHCGPRFTIIENIPYDRLQTTMREFRMCPTCQSEYENPDDRRFHAQPNACPDCGPQVEWVDTSGRSIASRNEAIAQCVELLRDGRIAAVKGLGGFHLMADAGNTDAVQRLRRRKHRDEKPFALMMNAADAETVCDISLLEKSALHAPGAPIVLLAKKQQTSECHGNIAENIAANNPWLGVMLPYTPLHHIILEKFGRPLVATSGNLSDDTICTDNHDALERLSRIADAFLMHNRRIARHADDSIVRVINNRLVALRRARGYAPLPVRLRQSLPAAVCVGGHLKNTVCVGSAGLVFPSQHIGDLDTPHALQAFHQMIDDFSRLYDITPDYILHDAHPDYASTRECMQFSGKKIAVQHHVAHVLSCMAENDVEPPVLGVAWDGTGYGPDGTVWGGEWLDISTTGYTRAGHLRTFALPGGDVAVKQPWRSAVGLLYELYGTDTESIQQLPPLQAVSKPTLRTLLSMLNRRVNSPRTSSAGRLFDAVASILDIQHINHFESQAAMALEHLAWRNKHTDGYDFDIRFDENRQTWVLDWQPMIHRIINDDQQGVSPGRIAAGFHNTLAEMIVTMAQNIKQPKLVLSGGTFQNRYLSERVQARLEQEGFQVYTHQQIPPNDGGISLGQYAALTFQLEPKEVVCV
ncbi:MAG: carbamoyltransferase HypF [candidate division KSB1 bacterium]|nr:carbamoyltransferase HypF [candidate division KSB1 bacterium]